MATSKHFLRIAKHLKNLHESGESLIVVVSAMGDQTNKLIELSKEISQTPQRRELDMLLSSGERVSMALMGMALHDLGVPAISFTGSQAGIMTNQIHGKARIADVKPIRVHEALNQRKIVIIAGFQGVDPNTKEVTTLGRGGSDTTAVALAGHFKAIKCATLKDVDGVYNFDPKKVDSAKPLKTISFDALKNMCFWGSQILHYRSVALAEKTNIPLFIGNSSQPEKGTQVTPSTNNNYEKTDILSINTIETIFHISIKEADLTSGYKEFSNFIQVNNLALPKILASAFNDGKLRMMVTDSKSNLEILKINIEKQEQIKMLQHETAALTVTFNGAIDLEIIESGTQILKKNNIETEKILTSHISISFIVDKKHSEKGLKVLSRLAETSN